MGDNNKRTIHYDKTLKNLFNISDRLTIYAINAFFKKDFKEDTKIQQLNREYIKLDKTTAIADTVLNIEINEQNTKYHIEFQTLNDRTLIIRMIDYGFRIAIDNLDYNNIKKDEELTVEFPSQVIIFLKKNEAIPDELKLTIKMPYTQQNIKYIVPTFKIWEHDPNYYKKQKLYIMLPLEIINLREELENLKKRKLNEKQKSKLITEYKNKIKKVIESIIKELKDALIVKELIIEECNKILMELATLADELFSHEVQDIKQEVGEMAKMILDPEVYKRGLKEGMQKGIEKGIEKGEIGGMIKTIIILLTKKLGEIPSEYIARIKAQDKTVLEVIADNIFDIQDIKDLDKYLKQ
jgi:hypothetical protein